VTLTHSADCQNPVCPERHDESAAPEERLREALEQAIRWPGGGTLHFAQGEWRKVANEYDAADRAPMSRPTINAGLLGRAIREHRQAEFDPHAVISMTHLCFDDCAENIAARYDELASR
jgi:hypothetical protein